MLKDRVNFDLVVHAGLGKTGTTAIQKGLFQLTQLPESAIFSYPNISGAGHGYYAINGVSSGNANLFRSFSEWNNLDQGERWAFAIKKALDESKKLRPAVLSSENLSILLNTEFFWSELIHSPSENVRVVLYFRNLFDHFAASWKEEVKFGFMGSINDFLEPYLTSERVHSFYVPRNLRNIIELAQSNGISIKLMNYELTKNNLIENFLTEGCSLDRSDVRELISSLNVNNEGGSLLKRVNDSLDFRGIEFFRGISSASGELSRLLSWEFTSEARKHLRLEQQTISRNGAITQLSSETIERLGQAFSEFQTMIHHDAELSKINCEIDEIHTLPIPNEELEIRRDLFFWGRLVGQSFDNGYISWSRKS